MTQWFIELPVDDGIAILAAVLFLIYVLFAYSCSIRVGTTRKARIVYVCDGDTLIARSSFRRFRIRLAGLDAPESEQEGGKESQRLLERLVGRKTVSVRIVDKDHWGRYVGFVSCGELDVNLEMIRQGEAWAYRQYFFNLSREEQSTYVKAEKLAKFQRLGIWKNGNIEKPWEWRKKHRWLGTWLHFLWLAIWNILFGWARKKKVKNR